MFVLFLFLIFLGKINGEATKQCYCADYEKCLKKGVEPPMKECFKKCENSGENNDFVSCMQKQSEVFETLRNKCSYSETHGFNGCTYRENNILNQRSINKFTDLLIQSIAAEVKESGRHIRDKKKAQQAECIFECVYPGRNLCTREMKCDIFLPAEKTFFQDFKECGKTNGLYDKAQNIYKCLSILINDTTKVKRRHVQRGK